MTEKEVKNNLGNLFRFKTELFWYGIDWDKNPGSICVVSEVLDGSPRAARRPADHVIILDASTATQHTGRGERNREGYYVNAFINGNFALIWVHSEDIELINDNSK